ncbi:hypothetical protein [Mycobacterium sp. ACS1612]|uniref:hypothetical protein n=1 Tax=Mycobacterium sp. ACS1612 TaxID=1834117 RepID=UPI000AC28531|nr:hypothetical protein [Mycobacterium sp. ACS1612]
MNSDLASAKTRNCGLRKTGRPQRRPFDFDRLQRELATDNPDAQRRQKTHA